jgi:ParB family chromosome partitioning protein
MPEGKNKLTDEMRPRGLGRGLSALIADEAVNVRGDGSRKVPTLPIAFLRPNRFQPRKRFDEEDIRDLAESIREKGVLQPILIRPVAGDANAFEIIAGERRWRAAQLAQLHEVPVVIRDIGDAEALELAIVENVQRSDLNAIEEAAAYHELMDRFGYTQEQISHEVGKSRSHVANTLRLLKLPESVKAMLREGSLTAGHARTLLSSPDPEAHARDIVAQSLNVREAEQRSNKKTGRPRAKRADPNTEQLQASLSSRLGLVVQVIHRGSNGGELRIAYKTLEQLDHLIHKLKN